MLTRFRLNLISLLFLGSLSGCATQFKTNPEEIVVIRSKTMSHSNPTIIFAHGCDGAKGKNYRQRAEALSRDNNSNVVIYDSFAPRGHKNLCGRGHIVPPDLRVTDTKEIAQWVLKQPWHKGKISFIGYSHGGSVGLALSNDREAATLISSVVSYYPSCNEKWIRSPIGNPLIPIMVHFGDIDQWTPMAECLQYKNHPNYKMFIYENSTHGFEAGYDFMALGVHPIRYNIPATLLAGTRTNEFFKETLK